MNVVQYYMTHTRTTLMIFPRLDYDIDHEQGYLRGAWHEQIAPVRSIDIMLVFFATIFSILVVNKK